MVLATEQLCCGNELVALAPKASRVLRRVVEDRGQLVSKAELLRAGWEKNDVGASRSGWRRQPRMAFRLRIAYGFQVRPGSEGEVGCGA